MKGIGCYDIIVKFEILLIFPGRFYSVLAYSIFLSINIKRYSFGVEPFSSTDEEEDSTPKLSQRVGYLSV